MTLIKRKFEKKKSTNALLAVKQVCLQLFPEYAHRSMGNDLRLQKSHLNPSVAMVFFKTYVAIGGGGK